MQMQPRIVTSSIAPLGDSAHTAAVISSGELLKRLETGGHAKAAIARVLGIDRSSVTLMFKGRRKISLDEGKTLVEHFHLDDEPATPQLSEPVMRLMVLHAAESLGIDLSPDDPRVQELASDYRAFAAFAADPRARDSVEQAGVFFRALNLRRATSTDGQS